MNVLDNASPVQAKLTASVVQEPDRLLVRYRVENTGDAEVLVLDQLGTWGIGDEYEFSPENVYVDLDRQIVRLTKGSLSVPLGAKPREAPYGRSDGRLVAAGGSVEVSFVVPLPIKVRNPYRRDMGPGGRVATKAAVARIVVLDVGIVPRNGGSIFSHGHPAHPDVLTVLRVNADPVERWQTILSQRFELDRDLPVLDYETVQRPLR